MDERANTGRDWEYEQTGGLRSGLSYWFAMNWSWPFAHLRASPNQIVLTMKLSWEPERVLPREHVLRVSEIHGFFSRGVRFEHDVSGYPRYLVFWTLPSGRERLLKVLRAMGYPVE